MIDIYPLTAGGDRRCDHCGAHIAPGERYLAHRMSPGHVDPETGEQIGTGRTEFRRECASCARLVGRGNRLGDLEATA